MKRILIIIGVLFLFCSPVCAEIETSEVDCGSFTMEIPTGWMEENLDNPVIFWTKYCNPDTDECLSIVRDTQKDTGYFSPELMCDTEFKDEIRDNDDGSKTIMTYSEIGVSESNLWRFCHAYEDVFKQRDGVILDEIHYYALIFHDLEQHKVSISLSYDKDNSDPEILEYAEQMHETIEFK